MRRFIVFAATLALTLGLSDVAEAGKRGKKGKGKKAQTEMAAEQSGPSTRALQIERTGVDDVDAVFMKAKDPVDTVRRSRAKVNSVSTNLNTALGLAEGTSFADALGDLKQRAEGKIQMVTSGEGFPKLEASDAVPEDVQRGITAVNTGVDDAGKAKTHLESVPDKLTAVSDEASEISLESLTNSGVSPLKAPKVLKQIKGNLDTLSMAKDEPMALTDSINGLFQDIRTTFADAEG
ncbi:MAG: hypothetical protein KTR31_13975 [Myxococcales bacterium]|nr:hypothetical protein [Myxococcales bacterium]